VVAWFALVAVLVVACSKETPPPPTTTNAPVVSAAPSTPGSEPSAALWASGSGSTSAAPVESSSAAPTATAPAKVTATATASASASAPAGPKVFACGGGDKPKCPLQNWMNSNMKPGMSSGDPAKVAALLKKIASMAPPGYANWAKISNDAAAAVESKKDVNAAKPSCTKCHEEYKTKYKTEDRDRAI
jgi:hypothetical protein